MAEWTSSNGVTVECRKGDITAQPDIDVIVNAANAGLRPGGGVAGAIHRAAGPGLEEECRPLAPIRPGEAVITGAHNLPNQWVVHCLGPVFGRDEPADRLLSSCYRNALLLAEQKRSGSIAFPAISTGVFGYPVEPAARVAIETVLRTLPHLSAIRKVRFVLHTETDLRIHEQVLNALTADLR